MKLYTPTTEGVRDTYVRAQRTDVACAEFDRWLASVKAEAWDEGARSITGVNILDDAIEFETANNPYRDTK